MLVFVDSSMLVFVDSSMLVFVLCGQLDAGLGGQLDVVDGGVYRPCVSHALMRIGAVGHTAVSYTHFCSPSDYTHRERRIFARAGQSETACQGSFGLKTTLAVSFARL